MSAIKVRNIATKDMPDIAEVFISAYAAAPYNDSWRVEQAIRYLSRFLEMRPDTCLCIMVDDSIVGAVFGYDYIWKLNTNIYIQEIFVSPQYQGTGLGRKMISALVAKAAPSGFSYINLVARTDVPAVNFYNRLGIKEDEGLRYRSGRIEI